MSFIDLRHPVEQHHRFAPSPEDLEDPRRYQHERSGAAFLQDTAKTIALAIAAKAPFRVSATILEGWAANALLEVVERRRANMTRAELYHDTRGAVLERLRRPMIARAFVALERLERSSRQADVDQGAVQDQRDAIERLRLTLSPSSRRAILLSLIEGLDDEEAAACCSLEIQDYCAQLMVAVLELEGM